MCRHPIVTFVAFVLLAGALSASGLVHAVTTSPPQGHVTIHRFSFQGVKLLVAPPLDLCFDINTGLPVKAGDSLSSPNPGVSCVPLGSSTCNIVDAGGYHAAAGGGLLRVTSTCGALSVTKTLGIPFKDPGSSAQAVGNGTTPWLCTVDESSLVGGDGADYWVFCDMSVLSSQVDVPTVPVPVVPTVPTVPVPVVPQLIALCDASNPNYQPTQAIHVFVVSSAFGVTMDSQFIGAPNAASAQVFDTSGCLSGDGDHETGMGAAQFPEVSQGACDQDYPVVGHHSGGWGATATVQSNTANLLMDYAFGTDGQTGGLDAVRSPCAGNGVISDNYDTDPFDCGQGITGHFPGGWSATLAPNVNPHDGSTTDPDPWASFFGPVAQGTARADPNGVQCYGVNDGSAWAFIIFGPSETGLIANPPLIDTSGCPAPVGDGSSAGGGLGGTGLLTGPLAGSDTCGLHGGVGGSTVGTSTPLQGTITAP
ncbi:MAG: hypothetical protein QOE90_1718 [Thermoplasmata archaeon]|jgi:hypothetical protein|nr:hypothetical protein [Thermoplasmata archaeon]